MEFAEFCNEMTQLVPDVFLWAAAVYNHARPKSLQKFKFTTPLRSPPAVVREVMMAKEIQDENVSQYTASAIPIPTDGPVVRRIKHQNGWLGHNGYKSRDCQECGCQIAKILTELKVGLIGKTKFNEYVFK